MAPEDPVINPSSLTKFHKLRHQDVGLLDMLIQKTIEIALEKDLIKSRTIIVDVTHTKARYNQKSPKEILMEKSKNLRKTVYQIDKKMKEKFPSKITTNEIEDELTYCRQVIKTVEAEGKIREYPNVKEKINYLKEIVEDRQKQLLLSVDPDARVVHRTEDTSFFGYKYSHCDV
jgi:hypothetical protein